MDFTHDEINLISIYNTGSRKETISVLRAMRQYLEADEQELMNLTDSALKKLGKISDEQFEMLDLIPDFDE